MTRYFIDKYGDHFHSYPSSDAIAMCLDKETYNKLTDDEIRDLTINSLVHEQMHLAIYKIFTKCLFGQIDQDANGLCCMFDIIQEHFKTNNVIDKYVKIHNKLYPDKDFKTWDDRKKTRGYKHILDYYRIDDYRFNRIKQIANGINTSDQMIIRPNTTKNIYSRNDKVKDVKQNE